VTALSPDNVWVFGGGGSIGGLGTWHFSTLLFGLALIPGTASLWAVGSATRSTGADAVIWAFGTV
jgi:hypothetical protein